MKRSTVVLITLFFLSVLFSTEIYAQGGKISFFVALNGKAGNPGTQDQPFQRPEQALDVIRNMKGTIDATIYIRGGIYSFSKSLVIADEPDANRHVLITGFQDEKVIFSGGQKLDNSKFSPVSDVAILNRLPAAARGKVVSIDLKAAGITNYGKKVPHGYKAIRTAPLELFDNGTVLTVARYPNEGYLPIGNVLDPGGNRPGDRSNRGATFSFEDSRMNNWKQAHDAWVGGYLSFGYSDDYLRVDNFDTEKKTIHLGQPAVYSVYSTANTSDAILKNSQNIRGFYVYNLLEEIDQPGEWYLDDTTGILYLWPPQAITASSDLEVSLLDDPLVVLSGTANIYFNNISFEYSRGMGMLVENTKGAVVSHCVFANLGTVAVSAGNQLVDRKVNYHNGVAGPAGRYTSDLLIQSCSIHNTGTGGVLLEGGDRRTLEPGNNVVDNCEIYNYSRINRTFCPAVAITGVGNKVTHCYIHDAPDQAISFYGNDHTIAYNHFEKVTSYMTDAGSVGTGRDIASTGNKIDYNFFDNITSTIGSSLAALYLDDGSSGMEVDGNVFYKAGTAGTYHFGAVHVNGGTDNIFRNNYFIDCQKAFSNNQWNDQAWRNVITDQGIAKVYRPGVDMHAGAYRKEYPNLEKLLDSNTLAPRMNYSYNTIAYNVGEFSTGAGLTHKNPLVTKDDPGFANVAGRDFTLQRVPAALQQAGDFKPVPFREIGPKKN